MDNIAVIPFKYKAQEKKKPQAGTAWGKLKRKLLLEEGTHYPFLKTYAREKDRRQHGTEIQHRGEGFSPS